MVEACSNDCIWESASESPAFCLKDTNARWSDSSSSGLVRERAEAYSDYCMALSTAVSLWLCIVDWNREVPLPLDAACS